MRHTIWFTVCYNLATHRHRGRMLLVVIVFYLMIRSHFTAKRKRRLLILKQTIKIKDKPLITFSGAGQLTFYYQGVCAYLKDHFHLDHVRFSGISAGSTAAASLAARLPTEASMIFGLRWFKLVGDRRLKLFLMSPQLMCKVGKSICSEFGIDDEYVRSVYDKTDCYYGVSNFSVWPPRHELLSGFKNRYESLYAMSCSMRILPFFRTMGYFRNMLLVDGGFTALYSIPDDVMESKVIRVSACSRIEADIQPDARSSSYFTILDVFKMPSLDFIGYQFERGYKDAMRNRYKLIGKGLRPKIQSDGSEDNNKLEYWMKVLRKQGKHIFFDKDGLQKKDYSHLLSPVAAQTVPK